MTAAIARCAGADLININHADCHDPRKRMIQYAVALTIKRQCSGMLNRPVTPGDDSPDAFDMAFGTHTNRYAPARRFLRPNIAGSCCARCGRTPRAHARRGFGFRRNAPAFAVPAPARSRRRLTRSATARLGSGPAKGPELPAQGHWTQQQTHGSSTPPDQRPPESWSGNIEKQPPA